MHKIATRYARQKARNEDERDRIYQDCFVEMLRALPNHDPTRGNLEAWLDWPASHIDSKTLNSALSFPRDPAMRFRTLLGTNATYDSFIHAAEEMGIKKFEANVAWLNAGPTDYHATFADVDSDFFGDDLAISGDDVEDEVLNAEAVSEIMAIFAEKCDPRAYKVWNLINRLPEWTYAEIGAQLDPPISAPTVSRDYKKAQAALLALGQFYWDQQSGEANDVA